LETQDLKDAGLKATLPRLRILQIMEESDQKHLSAEDVSNDCPPHEMSKIE